MKLKQINYSLYEFQKEVMQPLTFGIYHYADTGTNEVVYSFPIIASDSNEYYAYMHIYSGIDKDRQKATKTNVRVIVEYRGTNNQLRHLSKLPSFSRKTTSTDDFFNKIKQTIHTIRSLVMQGVSTFEKAQRGTRVPVYNPNGVYTPWCYTRYRLLPIVKNTTDYSRLQKRSKV